MKFKINANEFVIALSSAKDIATKNISQGFENENMMYIEAQADKVVASAFGGSASVVSQIDESHFGSLSYESNEVGGVTVDAKVMLESLSVFKGEEIDIEFDGSQLTIYSHDDRDFSQVVPTFKKHVIVPKAATEFTKEISINREVFLDGIRRVQFCMGDSETQAHYMCLILIASKNSVRFIAGDGGRFAISDISGRNIVGGQKNEIVIPRFNLSNIVTTLSNSSANNVEIKYAKKDDDNGIAEQIVVGIGADSIHLFKIDSKISIPDVNKFLDFDYPNKVICNLEDWKKPIAGIKAGDVNDKTSDKIYSVTVAVDSKKDCLKIETYNGPVSKSKVSYKIPDSSIKDSDPWFKCCSSYLKLISSIGGAATGDITFNFENQEGDGRIKPIVVNYPEYKNAARDTVEHFNFFFIARSV